MSLERIPLFPLEVVLFPGAALPLHIFEPRYKQMVRHCMDEDEVFGVVLARSEGIAPAGCTAEIVQIVKKYEDGRMDILTAGQRIYHVVEVFDDKPYLEGAVEYPEDQPGPGNEETQKKLLVLYEQCHTVVYGRSPTSPQMQAGASLAYQIASELPLDLDFKQELLELRAESERQDALLERLTEWLPQLSHLERARGKAGGNGHGLG
ncbi:MAG TPA: LON peptidase substrate-binding domain-containing protein [Candidatus Acidoferrales bacterium]|jgi:ATP-dependent Lon protease|nr:LON peptidase substrate-binding domain-containing protein [Candidatus Acidoferrales bacterium]